MSVLDTIKRTLGIGEPSVRIRYYECRECGHGFESAKSPDRAQCMECLSTEVEAVGGSD